MPTTGHTGSSDEGRVCCENFFPIMRFLDARRGPGSSINWDVRTVAGPTGIYYLLACSHPQGGLGAADVKAAGRPQQDTQGRREVAPQHKG